MSVAGTTPRQWFFKEAALPFAEGRYTQESTAPFKEHLHHTFSVGAVTEGEVHYRVGGREERLLPGSLALINPETVHACNAAGARPRSYYMLYLDRAWCTTIQRSLWHNGEFIPVDCILVRDIPLHQLYCRTMAVLMSRDHLMEKEQMLVQLAEAIFARCCHPAVPVATGPQHVAELKEWLAADLSRDCTLQDFASQRGLNPSTLLRHFRSAVGIPPHAYRMNCRIEHGRRLLRQGLDIADVAYLCGFFDQSHFHRHFKAMTTITPKQYRDSFRQP